MGEHREVYFLLLRPVRKTAVQVNDVTAVIMAAAAAVIGEDLP